MSVEQTLRPREPPAHGSQQGRIEEQVHGDANGGTSRRDTIASLHARRMGALPGLDRLVEMTRGVGHAGQKRQVGSRERSARVRFDEKLVSVLPIALDRGAVRPFQRSRFSSVLHRSSIEGPARTTGSSPARIVTTAVPTVTAFVTH